MIGPAHDAMSVAREAKEKAEAAARRIEILERRLAQLLEALGVVLPEGDGCQFDGGGE